MKQIEVEKRTEVTTAADAAQQQRRFRCEGCITADGEPLDDFFIVFRSSKPPAFIQVKA